MEFPVAAVADVAGAAASAFTVCCKPVTRAAAPLSAATPAEVAHNMVRRVICAIVHSFLSRDYQHPVYTQAIRILLYTLSYDCETLLDQKKISFAVLLITLNLNILYKKSKKETVLFSLELSSILEELVKIHSHFLEG
jgi:hypothetical protein